MTQATEQLTEREPGRALVIAAIHAYAEWLAAHPDVPVPVQLEGTVHRLDDPAAEVAAVKNLADVHGATKHTSGNTGWATVAVMTEPLKVLHTVFCKRPGSDEPAEWL